MSHISFMLSVIMLVVSAMGLSSFLTHSQEVGAAEFQKQYRIDLLKLEPVEKPDTKIRDRLP